MFTISCPPKVIWLGRKGENEFRTIEVEASEWLRDYPNGTVSVVYHRPDGAIYLPDVTTNGNVTSWLVTATDTAIAGKGEVEYRITDVDVIGKSIKMPTMVSAAINATTDAPAPPPEDWTATAAEILGMIGNLDNLDTEAKNNLVAAINEAFNSGGGGAAIFEITVTEQSGSFTYSPTFAEIQAAITAGKVVVVNDNGNQYQYYWQTTNLIHFERVFEDDGLIFRRRIDIYNNGTADVDTYQLNVPMVNDAVLTIKQGGVTKGTFSANASSATEINLDAGDGGGGGIFVVNITHDGDTYSSDKTTAEILAAKNLGQLPVLYEGGVKYDLQIVDSSHAYFGRYEYDEGYITYSSFNITSRGAVSHFSEIRSLITSAERDTWDAKLSDAPIDGKQYARKNGAWAEVQSSGGGDNTLVVTVWLSDYGTPGVIIGTPGTTHAEIIDAIENEKDITLVAQLDDSANRYNFDIARSAGRYWPVVFACLIPPDDDYWGGEHTAVYISVSPANVWSISYDDYAKKSDIGELADLDTTDKSNIVAAINEVAASGGSGKPYHVGTKPPTNTNLFWINTQDDVTVSLADGVLSFIGVDPVDTVTLVGTNLIFD